AGSPGRGCVAAKMMRETTKRVRTPSRILRRTKPGMPRRILGRRRGKAKRPGGPAPGKGTLGPAGCSTLDKVDRAVPVAVLVEVQRASVRLQAGELRAVAVDEVLEPGDDVAASVVLDLLHLLDDLAALVLVDRPQGLAVQLVELGIVPVTLVERRGRQAAGRDLSEVVPGSPVVDGEGVLEVLVPVEVAEVPHLHVDAGSLRVLG